MPGEVRGFAMDGPFRLVERAALTGGRKMRRVGARVLLAAVILLVMGSAPIRAEDLSGLIHLLRQLPQLTDALQTLGPASAQSQRGLALTLLQRYSPTGFYIVDRYSNLPTKYSYGAKLDFMTFVHGSKASEIVACLSTAVHETCHAYTHQMVYPLLEQKELTTAPGVRYSAYYIGAEETILVKHTPVFATKEMESYFPQSLRTFRFSTYIYPSQADLGAQVEGVYGLLGEFTAYYHGTKAAVDMIGFYQNETTPTPENWFECFAAINSTYLSYLEFKLYILKYLLYARNNYPVIYGQIVSNREFVDAFLKIDRKFSDLLQSYFAKQLDIHKMLRNRGFSVNEDDEYLWIVQGVTKTGQANHLRTYKLLQEELSKSEYQDLMAVLARL